VSIFIDQQTRLVVQGITAWHLLKTSTQSPTHAFMFNVLSSSEK